MYNQSFSNTNTAWASANTAIGYEALFTNNPTATNNGINNTAVGLYALRANTIGYDNTGVGVTALFSNTVGYYNTAIGRQALFYNTTGNLNNAFGYKALRSNNGDFNTAYGNNALENNSTGSYNIAIGPFSLSTNTTGSYNTAIGSGALINTNTGYSNVAIGNNSGIHPSTPNIYNTASIGNDGFLNAFQNQVIIGNNTTAFIGGKVDWGIVSDSRIKNTVTEDVKGLDFISRLRPVTYYISSRAITDIAGTKDTSNFLGKYDGDDIKYTGFIAQEVEQAAKDVGFDFSGYTAPKNEWSLYTIRYATFVVPLVKAVQEQQNIIEDLQKQVEAGKAELPIQIGKQQKIIEEQNKKIEMLIKEMQVLKAKLN